MKLFLLTLKEDNDYESYESCVICAENEEDAKSISPEQEWDDENKEWTRGTKFIPTEEGFHNTWASSVEAINCQELGIASDNMKRGVVVSSYNAG